jgi:hypothetical protein
VLSSNKSRLTIGICCTLVFGLFFMPMKAVASTAEGNQSQQAETKAATPKDKVTTDKKKSEVKSKTKKSRQNNRTHFGMGFDQRNRSRRSSMGGTRQQGKGRGR